MSTHTVHTRAHSHKQHHACYKSPHTYCFHKHNRLFKPVHHSATYATTQRLLLSALSIAMLSVALVELALVEVQTAHRSRWGPDAAQQCSRQQWSKCSRAAVVISKPHSPSKHACACTNTLTTPDSSKKIAVFHLFCTLVAITYLLSFVQHLYSIFAPLSWCIYVGKKWAVLLLQQQWKLSSELSSF